jgi:aryl-alcohol dehydrogenase-like predicted oxidoreductase
MFSCFEHSLNIILSLGPDLSDMKNRVLGSTGFEVSEISLGTWEIGSDWGEVSRDEGKKAVKTALDQGVNFLDTADVYGDGRSEQIIAETLSEQEEEPVVATKAGRRLDPHKAERYTEEKLRKFVERSLKNLEKDSLDLLQLHCPPTEVYYQPEVFEAMEKLKEEGKIDHAGVSVEKVEEGLKAIEYDVVETVQIIFNIFRQRPKEEFFRKAQENDVGVIVRVPLASGLLTGKITPEDSFPEEDHRNYNREGEAFDKGETFAGVPLEKGYKAVQELEELAPEDYTLAQFSLKWILIHDAVSTVIPGSTNPEHIRDNVEAAEMPEISEEKMQRIEEIYEEYVKDEVHQKW